MVGDMSEYEGACRGEYEERQLIPGKGRIVSVGLALMPQCAWLGYPRCQTFRTEEG